MFKMHLKLRDQQLKAIMYMYILLYQNLTVTVNEKSIIDTHANKKKESKQNIKERQQITKGENERGKEEKTYKNNYKTINKLVIRTYILIITLNIDGLNAPAKRHTLVE